MKNEYDPQLIASQIEGYLTEHDLYYGDKPRDNGDASWTLALNTHEVTERQELFLGTDVPELIHSFHHGSASLLRNALNPSTRNLSPSLQQLNRYITAGVPDETIALWIEAAKKGERVFSSRPDMIIDANGDFTVIEYNADGGADKGNTQGVNDYSRQFLGKEVIGANLAQLFVRQISQRHGGKGVIQVATILPDDYRNEYDSQNRYFARIASEIGKRRGITWRTARLSDIRYGEDVVYLEEDGNRIVLDVVDREFKLPGFSKGKSFESEVALVRASLHGKVDMLGSVLPLSDKILLSTLFDPAYGTVFDRQQDLQDLHAPTGVVDSTSSLVRIGSEQFTIDDVAQLKPEFQMVLKRGGDTDGSTGSKGLVISEDVHLDSWKRALESALTEPLDGGSYWVIQRFQESARFPVSHIRNSRSKPKELMVINRFAPYYVATPQGMELGNILVTAGTDEETVKKRRNNIHGLRQNTYQAVSAPIASKVA